MAACSPRMHEPTFRKALQKAGLNPYFLEMANIREQCSWVHDDPGAATEKAAALTAAAVHARGASRAARAPLRRHVPEHSGHGRRHRRHDARPSSSPTRATASTSSSAATTSAATWRASTSRRPTSTPRATCSPSGSRASSSTPTSTCCSSRRSASVDGFVGNFKATHPRQGGRRRAHDSGLRCRQRHRLHRLQGVRRVAHHALRLRQAAQRRSPRSSSRRCCARAASTTKEGKAPAVRGHHPLRRQPQPGVPRLLLAGLLHDGAQVRPRDQVGRARRLRERRLHRHARVRQGDARTSTAAARRSRPSSSCTRRTTTR